MSGILRSFKEITKYPSAIFGLVIILILVLIAIFTIVKIPYTLVSGEGSSLEGAAAILGASNIARGVTRKSTSGQTKK